jgi:hypothetical protein
MNAFVISMKSYPKWNKREAREILRECEKLRASIDTLEKKAKEVIETKHKVLPFEKPDKTIN